MYRTHSRGVARGGARFAHWRAPTLHWRLPLTAVEEEVAVVAPRRSGLRPLASQTRALPLMPLMNPVLALAPSLHLPLIGTGVSGASRILQVACPRVSLPEKTPAVSAMPRRTRGQPIRHPTHTTISLVVAVVVVVELTRKTPTHPSATGQSNSRGMQGGPIPHSAITVTWRRPGGWPAASWPRPPRCEPGPSNSQLSVPSTHIHIYARAQPTTRFHSNHQTSSVRVLVCSSPEPEPLMPCPPPFLPHLRRASSSDRLRFGLSQCDVPPLPPRQEQASPHPQSASPALLQSSGSTHGHR